MVFNETVRAETRHFSKNRTTDFSLNPKNGKSILRDSLIEVLVTVLTSKPNRHTGKLTAEAPEYNQNRVA